MQVPSATRWARRPGRYTGRLGRHEIPSSMNDTARRVYSTRRLRIVVALLTLIFLPVVVGASLLIYQYMVFSVMVEQRLKGEEGRLPSRVYARPLVLRPG